LAFDVDFLCGFLSGFYFQIGGLSSRFTILNKIKQIMKGFTNIWGIRDRHYNDKPAYVFFEREGPALEQPATGFAPV